MNRPIRVLIVFPSPTPYRTRLFEEVARQPDVSLRVLYCSDDRSGRAREPAVVEERGFRAERLPGFSLFRRERGGGPGLYLNPTLPRYLRRDIADVVIVSGYAYPSAVLSFLLAVRRQLPAILLTSTHEGSTRLAPPAAFVKQRYLRWIVSASSAFLAVGSPQKRYLMKWGASGSSIFVMGQGVDTEAWRAAVARFRSDRVSTAEHLGVPNELNFSSVMRLSPEKNPDGLINAFGMLKRVIPEWNLLIAGDGPLRPRLRQQIEQMQLEGVHLLGSLNREDTERLLAVSDIFCLPSRRETWGSAVEEALAAGLPCVVTDRVGSAEDLILSPQSGFVVPADDMKALVSAMKELATSGTVRRTMAVQAERVSSVFSVQRAAEQVVAACQHAVSTMGFPC